MYITLKTEQSDILITAFTNAIICSDECRVSINIQPIEFFNDDKDSILAKNIHIFYRQEEKSDQSCIAIDPDSGLSSQIEIIEMNPDIRKYL